MKIFIFIVIIASIASANNIQKLAPLSDEMVAHINKAQTTWKAEKNKFQSLPLNSVKKLLGVPLDQKPSRLKVKKHEINLADLSVDFDARKHWPNCTTIGEV
jgi:hypothetical protein